MATNFDEHANFAYGTVLVPPSPADTGVTITLNSGEGSNFPDPASVGEYNITLQKASATASTPAQTEIARLTARSSDTLTVTRNQESSGAISLAIGDKVYLGATKKTLTDIESAINTAEGDIVALDTRLDTVETDINNIETLFDVEHSGATGRHDLAVGVEVDQGSVTTKLLTPENLGNSKVVFHDFLNRQALINGNFDVWQRLTTYDGASNPANNDGVYLADRWVLLSDGNDIVDVTRNATDVPSTMSRYSMKFVVQTANKKFGILQILETSVAKALAGQRVSLSFQAHTTNAKVIRNLRAGLLVWTSTADSPTKDVVSAWNAEGSDPTLVANWAFENTPANILISQGYDQYAIENVQLDTAGINNIGIFIWVDDGDAAVNDELFLSQVMLNVGYYALPFSPKSFAEELTLCQRYYEKSFAVNTAPVQNVGDSNGAVIMNALAASTAVRGHVQFKVPKRVAPTVVTYNPDAANAQARNQSTGGDCSSTTGASIGESGFQLAAITPGGSSAGDAVTCHWSADSEF